MPNSKSAEKRVRQNKKQNAVNNHRKRLIKEGTRQFMNAVLEGDVVKAELQLRSATAILDRVAGKRTIHPNTAARRKSLLARKLNALRSPTANVVVTKPGKSKAKASKTA
ncbi:MAG: 30S ribosomal protein S20 [Planctomycetota bacterium]|nr:MAG: 30S ribosomal protein S20 [Planctomycetota bacterium]